MRILTLVKSRWGFFCAMLCCCLSLSGSVAAESYIVVDVASQRVLAQKQPFKRWYPASLTKLMTSYLAFQAMRAGSFKIFSPILVSPEAKAVAPVMSPYKSGTIIPFETALQLLLVHSTNDLAVALAQALGGSEANFIADMNWAAHNLGMYNTNFTNPHGLFNKEHYSTAYDLALLALALRREFPQYAHFFNIEVLAQPNGSHIIKNSNNLLGRFWGADGLKTGFTCASGYNLAASATREKRTIIAIVLGCETIEDREVLAAQLLHEAFLNSGINSPLISQLRPYGNNLDQALDMRAQACSAEARRRNQPYLSKKRKAPFPSPYLAPVPEISNIVYMQEAMAGQEEARPESEAKQNKASGAN